MLGRMYVAQWLGGGNGIFWASGLKYVFAIFFFICHFSHVRPHVLCYGHQVGVVAERMQMRRRAAACIAVAICFLPRCPPDPGPRLTPSLCTCAIGWAVRVCLIVCAGGRERICCCAFAGFLGSWQPWRSNCSRTRGPI
jgi:hypothetical protein